MAKATVAELEVLFTADTRAVDKAASKVEAQAKKIEKDPVEVEVDGDASDALAAMDRVEAEAKKIVSAKTMATVDANIERAETSLEKVQERLDYLRSVEADMEVTADIKRAEKAIDQITRRRDGLVNARAKMEIDADTSPAEEALASLPDEGAAAGGDTGDEFGKEIIAALATIPIAGAVIGVLGAAAKAGMKAFQEGLQAEKSRDRLQALTGIDEAMTRRMANAAAESYANVFGESIEANMDTARLGLQFNLIDSKASTRDAQKVIQGLSGIADVLDEDVRPIAAAVATMLSTGVVKSAEEAFDVLAAGARNGVNSQEDLIDTFTEYPALFKRLGLSGEEALGLVSQGLKAGARNSDLAADALKEFQIRATDGSVASAEGFRLLGLNASEMTSKIAAGGDSAKNGLDQVLDALRSMTDPVQRNAAAVALFGTQAEDLGEALFAMDLTTAVDQLDGVTGAAQRMFDTMSSNDATKVDAAMRNIEVAADGVKASLAVAFSEPLGNFADWVSQNRGPLLKFFQDLINGALDFAVALTEGVGEFTSGPLADAIEGMAGLIEWLPGDQDVQSLKDLADGMRNFDKTTDKAVENIEEMRTKFNEFAGEQVNLGYVHDAALKTAGAIGKVGYAADGSKLALDKMRLSSLDSSDAGRTLETQIKASVEALNAELTAAQKAGEGQDDLKARYQENTAALMSQLTSMGLTQQQAYDLITAYGAIPSTKGTSITSNAPEKTAEIKSLGYEVRRLPDGSITIQAKTTAASKALEELTRERTVTIHYRATLPDLNGPASGTGRFGSYAQGALVEFMARGGLSPMHPIAQMVPPNTYRVIGDRGDVDEAYIPLDGSARSVAILMEALRRMPGLHAMQSGGVLGSPRPGLGGGVVNVAAYSSDPYAVAHAVARIIERLM